MSFEGWWDNHPLLTHPSDKKIVAQNAWEAAIDTVNSLPHRVMFDEGYELGKQDCIKQQEEITDMCITAWVSTLGTLKEKVQRLIQNEVMIALDPAVSREAQALINHGLERAAEVCKDTPYRGDSNHDGSVLIYEREVIAVIREEIKK